MPARLSSMELSPTSDREADLQEHPSRRKSGRVTKKPELHSPSSAKRSTKRKRVGKRDVYEEIGSDDQQNDESDVEQAESDEEAPGNQRRKARKTNNGKTRPTSKKGDDASEGATTNLAIRSNITGVTTSKKARRPRSRKSAVGQADGLYGEIYAENDNLDKVAANWLKRFKQHEYNAVAEIVNFVLRCAGCEITVDEHDIEDPDHCANRLSDIQDEFQAQTIVDYPLIAKNKGATSFRRSLHDFFDKLVQTIAESEHLYESTELLENVQSWIGTMSSATTRPFRHTATVVSLAIISALSEIAQNLSRQRANILVQSQTEQKKARVNKARVNDLQKKADIADERSRLLKTIIEDWFSVIFISRYKDFFPRIRVECAQYLGQWTMTYPDHFLDGEHLRYLGWALSDIQAPVRLEAAKQLQKLYKDEGKITGLMQFTEHFRSVMINMATNDADINIRATIIELLDILRGAGLLEPDDIDKVGKLIFDSEARVRHAVAQYFAANIQDVYDSKVEDLGGEEAVEDFASADDDDDLDRPRLCWLKFKSFAELMASYDSQDEDSNSKTSDAQQYLTAGIGSETRFGLASEALLDDVKYLQRWETLAAYLLFDHSAPSRKKDARNLFLAACRPEEKEELILLETLYSSVRYTISKVTEATGDTKAKKSKAQRQQLDEEKDVVAQKLTALIPKLLNKFGASPDTALVVLRLHRIVDLQVLQDMPQGLSAYSNLLDEISKQFMSHDRPNVLAEACAALLHAKGFEAFDEATDAKLQAVWEDLTHALVALCRDEAVEARGSIPEASLTSISNTVLHISHLTRVSSCTEALEALRSVKPDKSRRKSKQTQFGNDPTSALSVLIRVLDRGVPTPDTEPEIDTIEDTLVTNAANTNLLYFMWKVTEYRSLIQSRAAIPEADVESLCSQRDAIVHSLSSILQRRARLVHGADTLRVHAAGILLDLHTCCLTLKHTQPARPGPEQSTEYLALVVPLDTRTQSLIMHTFAAAEKAYARKTRRTLDPASDDSDPEASSDSSDEEVDEMGDAIVVNGIPAPKTSTSALLAEQTFLEFASKVALALVGGSVLDAYDAGYQGRSMRKRLGRNKAKLGPGFKEVVAWVERGGVSAAEAAAVAQAKKKQRAAVQAAASKVSSKAVVEPGDDDDDEDDEERGSYEGEEDVRAEDLAAEDEEAEQAHVEREDDEVESVLGD